MRAGDIESVAALLSERYRDHGHHNKRNPLSELLYILCSVRTEENKYRAAYAALRRRFPTFDALADAPAEAIAEPLQPAGLAAQKARAMKHILGELAGRFGRPTLAPLRRWDDEACESLLTSFPYVGKKVARCVMMCALDRQVFPVDVHCWRIARRLGWVRRTRPDGTCSPKDMDRLQGKIPPALRYSLHVNLLSLGRDLCTAARPRCGECPVRAYCRTGRGADEGDAYNDLHAPREASPCPSSPPPPPPPSGQSSASAARAAARAGCSAASSR
ncbi:MAG: endonuclease III domain-containing protein [Gemmataceae bacterium]